MTLLAAYSFDEVGDTVVDQSGNGRDFSIASTNVIRPAGSTNTGLAVSATSTVTGPPVFGETAARTLMFWMKGGFSLTSWIWEYHDSTANTGRWGFLMLSGSFGFRGHSSSGYASVPAPTDDLWHHWAGTYDGSAVRLYMDGVLQGSPVSVASIGAGDVLRVFDGVDATQTIDDLRVYDEALDQPTISALLSTPVVPPASGSVESEARVWNGTSWVVAPAPRIWNGTSWAVSPGARLF